MKTVTFITAIFYQNVISGSVPETTGNYSCGEGPNDINSEHARAALHCEQIWTTEDNPIGIFSDGRVECHEPCIEVTPGGITISNCGSVTLTVICLQEYLSEYRIHFHGIINHIPPNDSKKRSHQAILAALAMFLLVTLGLTFQYYKSSWN